MNWNWNIFVFGVVSLILCNKCISLSSVEKSTKPLSPVILVPGGGGSQIEARLNKPEVVHFFCYRKSKDWFNVWLNVELLVPYIIDCWVDNVSLIYENKTRIARNRPGVESRVSGWGDPETVEWTDPKRSDFGTYFHDIGNTLVANGYVRKLSIRAAPYDFRKAPNENKLWFLDLKVLVEETYEANNKVPVTFIAHSTGAPMTLLFLQQQDKSWKSKYVCRIISISGVWAGSVRSLKTFATGDDLDTSTLNERTMRKAQSTFPFTAWSLPSSLLWKSDEVLVQTQSRNYTVSDLEGFFKLIYSSNDLNSDPKLIHGDGDGVANSRSLEVCTRWLGMNDQLGKNVSSLRLPYARHIHILHDNHVLQYILGVLIG